MPLPRLNNRRRNYNEKKKKEPYTQSSLCTFNNGNSQHYQRKVEETNIFSTSRNNIHSVSKKVQSSQLNDDDDRHVKENILCSTKHSKIIFQKNVSASLPILSSAFTIQSTDHTIEDHNGNHKHQSTQNSNKNYKHKFVGKKNNSKLDSNSLSSLPVTTKQYNLTKSPISLRRQRYDNSSSVVVPEVLSCQVKELPDMSPSQTIDVNISMGLKDYRSNQYKSAIDRFKKAIEHNSLFFFLPRFVRGLCYYYTKQYDLAILDFSTCSYHQENENHYSNRSYKNERKNRFHGYNYSTDAAARVDQSNHSIYGQALAIFNRGVTRVKLNGINEALEDYNKAILLYKYDCDFYKNRALLHRRMGNFEAAQQDYQQVRQIEKVCDEESDEEDEKQDAYDTICNMSSDSFVERKRHLGNPSRKISLSSPTINVVISGKKKMNAPKSPLETHSPPPIRPSTTTISMMRVSNSSRKDHRHDSSYHQFSPSCNSQTASTPKCRNNKKLHKQQTFLGRGSPSVLIRKRPRSYLRDLKASVFGQLHIALITPAKERNPSQLQILVEESKMMTAFAHLDKTQLYTLWQYLEYRKYPSNYRIIEQDDPAEDYYLVWTGRVSARVRKDATTTRSAWLGHQYPSHQNSDNMNVNIAKAFALENEFTVNIMTAGETLGEAVMYQRGKRRASCVTEEPTEVLILKKEHFDQTFQKFLQKAHETKMDILATFACFSHWNRDKLRSIANVCRERKFEAGEAIIKQNSAATSFYFIKSGLISLVRRLNHDNTSNKDSHDDNDSISLLKQQGGRNYSDVCVAKLCAGDIFGETCLMEKGTSLFSDISCNVTNGIYNSSNYSSAIIEGRKQLPKIHSNNMPSGCASSSSSSSLKELNNQENRRRNSAIIKSNPYSAICDTIAICYRLDKVQIKMEDWDKETFEKLSTMAVSYPKDDNQLYQAYLDQIRFQRQSKELVHKLVYN